MIRIIILVLFTGLANLAIAQPAIFIGPLGFSKGNSLNLVTEERHFSLAPNSQGPSFYNSPGDHLLPDHIRENPMQYSYLCLLEKKIERKLPIGLWLKLDNNNFGQSFSPRPGNAYIRMKMIRF